MQADGEEAVVAAGKWTISSQHDGLRVLLKLPSEDYVIAALSGEAAPDEPMASLKAMAISMRTFALVNANRHRAEGFGLRDSTHCQALRLAKPRPEVEQAVRETAGETLWSGGERAHIYYTQHCGGTSESASAVWPEEKADYLAGQHADPYCLRRTRAEWQTRIFLRQLDQIFHAQGWHTPSPVTDIHITQRDAAGRAALLQVIGQGAPAQLSASSFRFAVDRALGWNRMRSDWFSAAVSGADLEIHGRGYGHGVGLCQAGAFEMAKEGRSEREILSFYFPGTVPGITPAGDGWQRVQGSGWTLLTTASDEGLVADGNIAWARAQSLLGKAAQSPTVQELPTTELFRQTTGEPGWVLASTRGSHVYLQPATVRQNNKGAGDLLLHEFLHVLVEQRAGTNTPLWLREGLVEALAAPGTRNGEPVPFPAAGLNAALAHPSSAAVSRRAHEAAARMAALLCARYGMPGGAGLPAQRRALGGGQRFGGLELNQSRKGRLRCPGWRRGRYSAVPSGLVILPNPDPGLTSWAKIQPDLSKLAFSIGRDLNARQAEGKASLHEGHGFSRAVKKPSRVRILFRRVRASARTFTTQVTKGFSP